VARRFSHAAVISFEDGAELVLQSCGRPLVPQGIRLPAEAELPDAGEPVVRDGAGLDLGRATARRRLRLLGPGRDLFVPLQTAPSPPRPSPAAPRAHSLRPWRRIPSLDAGAMSSGPVERALAARLDQGLAALAAAVREAAAGGSSPIQDAVRGLLGLGRGSTPSGDDRLAGAAAAARTLSLPGARGLCHALASAAPEATTEAGWAMVREAALGYFVEPLALLAREWPAPRPATVAALLSLGGSSGADMLEGFLALAEDDHG